MNEINEKNMSKGELLNEVGGHMAEDTGTKLRGQQSNLLTTGYDQTYYKAVKKTHLPN
jgi:hypothetical protein